MFRRAAARRSDARWPPDRKPTRAREAARILRARAADASLVLAGTSGNEDSDSIPGRVLHRPACAGHATRCRRGMSVLLANERLVLPGYALQPVIGKSRRQIFGL